MFANRVLMIGRDPSFVQWVRSELDGLDETELEIAVGLESATVRDPDLIVVHLEASLDRSQLARLIADSGRSVPVLALSETYLEEDAAGLFRAGLADYLSRADHQGKITRVVSSLLDREPTAAMSGRGEPEVRVGLAIGTFDTARWGLG